MGVISLIFSEENVNGAFPCKTHCCNARVIARLSLYFIWNC